MFSRLATDDKRHMMGLSFPSHCFLCLQGVETLDHLFLCCVYTKCIWACIGSVFAINKDYSTYFQFIVKVLSHQSNAQIASIFHAAVFLGTSSIWLARNQIYFQKVRVSL